MQLDVGTIGGKRQIKSLIFGLLVVGGIWELAIWIVAGSDKTLVMVGLVVVVCALIVQILNDWRTGVLLFLVWLLFEDMARKYLGNSMTIYFAKDFLIGVAYMSFFIAKHKRRVEFFKIPFQLPLLIFFWFAVIQVFNPWSPNILYGLLGLKLYFYYAPLMLLGYAMLERPKDLERFLLVNIVVGSVVAGLGIAQSVLGITFLTPEDSAAELYALSHVTRFSPITHQEVLATSSVFVSAGRFSFYLILLWILVFGALGYLLLSRRSAKYGFLAIGIATVGIMVTGTRTPFVFVLGSSFVMSAAFLWGAPWKWGQGHRLVKALRRSFLFGGIALILMAEVFPAAIGPNWAFLSETLAFQGEGSEFTSRSWDYPVRNLVLAFQHERWVYGYGTGLNSLGMQYVSRLVDAPAANIGVESGYGSLVVEMGILGLLLWIFWVSALLWTGWRIVRQLRQTVYFPIGFAIWWYAVVLLVLLMYFGIVAYQNFVNNAYLWLLIGVLFRLPKLAQMPQPIPSPKHARGMERWQLATGRR
ncbi:MAG: hypothetical protein JWN92_3065 [Candidatus Acidoferrum typicum]|nr:hypothetical protein [Candidatus Acidoferrum typicum]